MSDVEPVARWALEEIGVWPPDRDVACWELARYWARGLQAGGSQIYERAAALWGLWWSLGSPPEIGVLVELMDEWDATLPGERRAIESELSRMARPIISAADRALAKRR